MPQVQTVRGTIDTRQLGLTLIHEHVLFQFDDSRRKPSVDLVVRLLRDAQAAGVQTVVDLTPVRRIDWLMEVAEQVDVHLVACTGFYLQSLTPRPLAAFSEAQMVERNEARAVAQRVVVAELLKRHTERHYVPW